MNHFIRSTLLVVSVAAAALGSTSELITSGDWTNPTLWSPPVVPQSGNDVLVRDARWVVISSNVGAVKSVSLGGTSGEGALNLHTGAALQVLNSGAVSVLVAGPANPYPSYYSHAAGTLDAEGDFVVGGSGLAGDAFFSGGALSIGGTLKVGAASGSKPSTFRFNGGGGSISAAAVQVGAAGLLEFNFLGGNSLKTVAATGAVTLLPGSGLIVTNATAVGPGAYTLIDGGSLSGVFTRIELFGFTSGSLAEVEHDEASGNVNLVVSGLDAVFDNSTGDANWSTGNNWLSGAPPSLEDSGLVAGDLVVNTIEEARYLTVGDSSRNAALNLYLGAALTLTRPGVSLVVGGVANGPGYPNYYSHSDGALVTAGDFVLGANGGKVDAQFSSGSIRAGGVIRIGSYQTSGPASLELRGGGGSIEAAGIEVGAAGTLVFDFLGGNSLKQVNTLGPVSLLPGATLTVQGAANVGVSTYVLLQGDELSGVFDRVNFSGFPPSVVPRLWYDASVGALKLVVEPAANAIGPISGFSKIVPLGPTGYSFGVAADGGTVLTTDYNKGTISRLAEGVSSVILSGYNGLYGVAVGNNKIYFVAGDENVSATLYEAELVNGSPVNPRIVATGFVRMRQLFVEASGHLLAALESRGQIVRINPETGVQTLLVSGLRAPQSAVSDSDGNLYFVEYGGMSADGTPMSSGSLWKLPLGGSPTLLHQVWRARGLLWLAQDRLGLFSEADYGDRGNSSSLTVLNTVGEVTDFLQGFDYAEFGATQAPNNGLTTCPRDRAVLSFLPDLEGGSEIPVALRPGVTAIATVRGSIAAIDTPGTRPVTLTGLAGGNVTMFVTPDGADKFAGWVRMSTEEWPSVSLLELPYPDSEAHIFTPGVYSVPEIDIQVTGTVKRVQVFAQRSQGLTRWPMQNVGTSSEQPQAGFSEAPSAFLAYIEVDFQPRPVVFTNSSGDNLWTTAANWSPGGIPTILDNPAIGGGRSVFLTADAGAAGIVAVGDSSGNAALNVNPGAALVAAALEIGSTANANNFPSYYSHAAGDVTTMGDLVLGGDGGSAQAFFSSGSLAVGGSLELGSAPGAKPSVLELRGGGGSIRAQAAAIGSAGRLIFDFLGGDSLKTLETAGLITLSSGSELVLTNAEQVIPNTYILLRGTSLAGEFSAVSVHGLSTAYDAELVYDQTAAEVRLVVSPAAASSGFHEWSGGTSAPDPVLLSRYAFGGASSPDTMGEANLSGLDDSALSLVAIVRTNDPKLSVHGQGAASLADYASSNAIVQIPGVPSANTNNVPAGCQRQVFSIERGGQSRLFLRLRAIYDYP